MALSPRATEYLRQLERHNYSLTEADIRRVFIANDAPVSDPLIEFELNYGGYMFYAGVAPIQFTLLKGAGGYPMSNFTANIDFEVSDLDSSRYLYNCAYTDYQMQFFLDDTGVYYEDYEAKAGSFEKMVEHQALWREMAGQEGAEVVFWKRALQVDQVEEVFGLPLIIEASDEYTQCYGNDAIHVEKWQGTTSVVVAAHFPDRKRLAGFK